MEPLARYFTHPIPAFLPKFDQALTVFEHLNNLRDQGLEPLKQSTTAGVSNP